MAVQYIPLFDPIERQLSLRCQILTVEMAAKWPDLVLPCSPSQRCLDRFSILEDQEDEDGFVQFWVLLQELLRQPVHRSSQLIHILDIISNTLRGSSGPAGDYGMLEAVIEQHNHAFYSCVWPTIVQLALKLPVFFPDGTIPILQPGERLCLTQEKTAAIVAHQFLCTLRPTPWRDAFYDFSFWYASEQRHPKAAQVYLTALLSYFEQFSETIAQEESLQNSPDNGTEFSLHSFTATEVLIPEHWDVVSLSPIRMIGVEKYSTEQQELGYQGPDGAVVVPTNKDIGFGQSATQEELYMGNCPEACPAVLFTPTLEDNQALVIRGARPMLRISGQRRDISWERLDVAMKHGGRMLLMDALEIDEIDDGELLPDLKPENIEREIKKAYTAFSSWNGAEKQIVWSGLWGCGAFNGEPAVKIILIWIAASLARKELRIICDSAQADFAAKTSQFFEKVPSSWRVKHLMDRLNTIPKDVQRLRVIDWLLDNMHDS